MPFPNRLLLSLSLSISQTRAVTYTCGTWKFAHTSRISAKGRKKEKHLLRKKLKKEEEKNYREMVPLTFLFCGFLMRLSCSTWRVQRNTFISPRLKLVMISGFVYALEIDGIISFDGPELSFITKFVNIELRLLCISFFTHKFCFDRTEMKSEKI